MRYCPDCGVGHECEAQTATAAVDREVEIARINAKRDVDVARLQARMQTEELDTAETIAKTEAEADVESAVAEAVIVGAALEAGVIGEEENAEPVVIDAPEPKPEPDGDELPPAEGSPVPEPARKSRGLGMW